MVSKPARARRDEGGAVRAAVVRMAAWWVLGFGLYLLLVPTLTPVELVVGLVVALAAAWAGHGAARAFEPPGALPPLRWGRLCWLPVDVARDVWQLLGLLARGLLRRGRRGGALEEMPLAGTGDVHAEQALRAYGVLVLSTTPGSYVVDVDVVQGGRDRVCVHRVGRTGGSQQAVTG